MSPAERDELIRWPEPLPRQDETDDATFYTPTRLVTHIDEYHDQAKFEAFLTMVGCRGTSEATPARFHLK